MYDQFKCIYKYIFLADDLTKQQGLYNILYTYINTQRSRFILFCLNVFLHNLSKTSKFYSMYKS